MNWVCYFRSSFEIVPIKLALSSYRAASEIGEPIILVLRNWLPFLGALCDIVTGPTRNPPCLYFVDERREFRSRLVTGLVNTPCGETSSEQSGS